MLACCSLRLVWAGPLLRRLELLPVGRPLPLLSWGAAWGIIGVSLGVDVFHNTKSYDNRRTYRQAPGADGVFPSAAAAVLPGTMRLPRSP